MLSEINDLGMLLEVGVLFITTSRGRVTCKERDAATPRGQFQLQFCCRTITNGRRRLYILHGTCVACRFGHERVTVV